MNTKFKLVIISPFKNEGKYIEDTLISMTNQTRKPDKWLLVNDNSTDSSSEIVKVYLHDNPWIEMITYDKIKERKLGPGVVEVFNYGLNYINEADYDIISKLDVDLSFDSTTIESVIKLFNKAGVGMAGGRLQPDRHAEYHIPGPAKFYLRDCFEDIGGLKMIYGWDILDETKARMLGWKTLINSDIEFQHLRLQGSAHGALNGRIVWGRGAYSIGTHPLFAIARGIYRMFEKPYIIGGIFFLWGFFRSYFDESIQMISDKNLVNYIRKEQIYRLFHRNQLPR